MGGVAGEDAPHRDLVEFEEVHWDSEGSPTKHMVDSTLVGNPVAAPWLCAEDDGAPHGEPVEKIEEAHCEQVGGRGQYIGQRPVPPH